MKKKTKARGISLIVLVITIIIIIILAGAVILSLSNSNVINKAKSGIMQTDIATVKEQIKTKMAENELNNINTKIGTQLWDSYYTMSVSQLQDIGITTKSDYLYNYNTGNLSVKQNNEYVTPEELYARDTAKNYIDGYVKLNFGSKEVTDAKIAAETNATAKAALQKQQLAQESTNGEIKVYIYDVDLEPLTGEEYQNALDNPKYQTETTNDGYFILNDITIETGKVYSILLNNFENTLGYFKVININNFINKTMFPKTTPLKLYLGDFDLDYEINQNDFEWIWATSQNKTIKKYDLSKDGQIGGSSVGVNQQEYDIIFGNIPKDTSSY